MEKSQHTCPVLVVYDLELEAIWALPVESNGPTKVAVDWVVGKLIEAGYHGQRITLQSDGESSVLAMKNAVAAGRTGYSSMVETPF